MVYQIYYGDKRPSEVLFDIEYFITHNETKENTDDNWYVELHSLSFISGAINYIRNVLKPELVEDFIKDCGELEELRGWVWETHRNHLRTVKEAESDKIEWGKYIERKIKYFCDKYGLYLNID